MIHFIALALLIGTQAIATDTLGWAKQYMAHGCGNSFSGARYKAKQAAKNTGAQLRDICEDDNGKFSLKITDGYCIDDTGDITCRVECTAIGIATCKF